MHRGGRSTGGTGRDASGIRLNRFLARAGVASRRKSDEIIRAGAVQVNGEVAASPGRTVSVDDDVRVDGNRVHLPDSFEYILLNKPSGLIVTRSDPGGRATVFDRIPDLRGASVSVGRLDRDTTGVLLLTDDGQLAYRLAHPRFEVEKRYEAVVKGRPAAAAVRRLGEGVDLDDGPTAQAQVRILSGRRAPQATRGAAAETRLEIRLHEGRNRQVRRMCQAVGHPVVRLARTGFAGLTTAGLSSGQSRRLSAAEVGRLRSLVGLGQEA